MSVMVTGCPRPDGDPSHTIALSTEQLRDAISLYVDTHRLVPEGNYTVGTTFWRDDANGITVKQEFWRNSEVER